MSATEFDLIIAGAGPAGCAAAIRAGQRGARAALVGASGTDVAQSWVSPDGVALLNDLKLKEKAVGAARFRGIRLHDWRGARRAEVNDAELAGWIVGRPAFETALANAANASKTVERFETRIAEVAIGEEWVEASRDDGGSLKGRALLIGDGAHSTLARRCGLVPAGATSGAPACMSASFDCDGDTGIDVILGAHREGKSATLVRNNGAATLTLLTRDRSTSPEAQWAEAIEAARVAGLLSGDLPAPTAYACPAGLALDLDTHIGKRSLLIGDAGGFVAAFSGEGLYPGMWSGARAAEIALDALAEPVPQDAMQRYSVEWRAALADYLRMPNTDLSLLMPLVFGNEQMTARVARAFVYGQPF
ncbi:MAG: FAD-dependent oxidoreductase [Phycisphaerales bacterium]|nr:FAD-dependent oxidoreductase [Phycisphaerales bacterium]